MRGDTAALSGVDVAARRAVDYARANRERFVTDLADFVRHSSVSARREGAAAVRRCADWLTAHLQRIGLRSVRLLPGDRHPAVWAASRRDPGRPTVLIYGHYDVQPPEPFAAWRSPPFRPLVDGAYMVGRGTSDDKGPVLAHIKAIESYLQTSSELPVNVVLLVEGEEEIGSPGLERLLDTHRDLFRADVAVMSDTRMLGARRPAISYSERGKLDLEVAVTGPGEDLHSGSFGGAVHNPIQALCEIVASLHDANGTVAVPGFYEQVRPVGPDERAYLARVGPGDRKILKDAHAPAGWGEQGYSLYERTTIRPALTLNGIRGGYLGSGGKSVIPSRASVKVNIRLVPDQDPDRVEKHVRAHLARVTPPTVRTTVRRRAAAHAAVLDRTHPAVSAAATAYLRGFGTRPVLVRSGGTIPIVSLLRRRLHIPTVLMGFALPDDRMHAPNERFLLANYTRGMETVIWFLAELGRRR
jgi:acetylornithine deacetylase/succinyl-diaminopimelate desuccinylase-like protein